MVLIVAASALSEANSNEFSSNALIQFANDANLSHQPVWLKLLHYEESVLTSSKFVSAIHDKSFFLATDGSTNPSAELESTIRALISFAPPDDANNHAQCKFPARFLWLRRVLSLDKHSIPLVKCEKFLEWTSNDSIDSISFVFASGFLGNPASYYGHILLKLNSRKSNQNARLFDPSVNYGAIIPPNEDPITYIVKGVLGGYDGGFSQTDYYFHNRNYGELELRDIWEYEVNLKQEDIDLVVAHAWEVLGKPYTYYFFRKNCAYRLAELLEVVDGIGIIPKNPLFIMPRAILQNMADSTINGKPLLKSIDYRPSRQSRFYKKFNNLNHEEVSEVRAIAENFSDIELEQFNQLPVNSQSNVLDALMDYYRFTKAADLLAPAEADELHNKALIRRFKLPARKVVSAQDLIEAPHSGRKSSQIRIGMTYNDSLGDGVSVVIRPAYYDALDATSGQVKDSALTMGEIKLFVQEGDVQVRHIDFLKIESANGSHSKLPSDIKNAWKLKLGIKQKDLSCQSCMQTRLEGDYGMAVNLHSNVLVSAYVGARVQDNRKGSGNVFIRASAFLNGTFSDNLNMRVGLELPKQIDGSGGEENTYVFEARKKIGENSDLRFEFEKNNAKQYSVYLGYYF